MEFLKILILVCNLIACFQRQYRDNECGWVPTNLHLQKQKIGWTWPSGCCLPALFHSVSLCSKLSVRYHSAVRFYWELLGFAGGSDGKGTACNAGDLGSNPGLERSLGEGNGNPLQCSCLEDSMDGGAWWATVHGIAKSWTQLSDFHFTYQSERKWKC